MSHSASSSSSDLQSTLRVMQERDLARQAEQNWRTRYEIEAQQRRAEAVIAQQAITHLKAEVQRLTQLNQQQPVVSSIPVLPQASASAQTLVDLQAKLVQVSQERDQLRQLLKAEQANHAKTRASLTTTLCDAMDALNLQQ